MQTEAERNSFRYPTVRGLSGCKPRYFACYQRIINSTCSNDCCQWLLWWCRKRDGTAPSYETLSWHESGMSLSRCWGETGASRLPGALFAKANTDSTQCYRASRCLAEQFCAFDPSSFCFTLNVGPSDTGLLLRCFESFGPRHLFIAGSPNLREQRLCFTSPTHHAPSGSTL